MSCSNCNHNNCQCNPCQTGADNTAACETLPSQIENFTTQFFGAVVKTEIDGVVSWSLPCGLDVGLENNPRGVDEGLACYFIRLFEDGILGATGPQGEPGTQGTNGRNAYTVTLASFVQPSIGAPNVNVVTVNNPAILPGLYVFIATSGWYIVNATDNAGTLFLTLVREIVGAPAVITAGKLVVPSGFPGASTTGPQGPQGATGAAGPQSPSFTEQNGLYFANVGTDYSLQIVYAAVDFVNSAPSVLLPATNGVYLVTAVIDVIGNAGIVSADRIFFKLFNTTIAGEISGSEHVISNIAVGAETQVTISTLVVTGAASQQVALYGKATSANAASAVALRTTMYFVRLA